MSNDTPTGPESPDTPSENAAPPPPPEGAAPPAFPPPPATPPSAGSGPTTPTYAPPPGYTSVAAPPDTRLKTLAIVAIVLAGIGLVMAFVPFVNWFAGPVLIAAFIVSLIALIGRKHGGTGLSIAALVISVVGWIVAFVMILISFFWIGGFAALVAPDQAPVTEATSVPPQDDEPMDDAVVAEDIVVLETAVGQYASDPGSWWYVAVIDNPNEDYIFDYASIDVEAIGADGTIVDVANEYRVLLSGETALVGDFIGVGDAEIVDLNIVFPGGADAVYSPFVETGELTLGALSSSSDGVSTTVTGTVSGDFAEDLELVQITVVARDPSGQIIGGAWTYVDELPSAGTAVPFEAIFWDPLPEGTVFEAYASL